MNPHHQNGSIDFHTNIYRWTGSQYITCAYTAPCTGTRTRTHIYLLILKHVHLMCSYSCHFVMKTKMMEFVSFQFKSQKIHNWRGQNSLRSTFISLCHTPCSIVRSNYCRFIFVLFSLTHSLGNKRSYMLGKRAK